MLTNISSDCRWVIPRLHRQTLISDPVLPVTKVHYSTIFTVRYVVYTMHTLNHRIRKVTKRDRDTKYGNNRKYIILCFSTEEDFEETSLSPGIYPSCLREAVET